MIHLLQVLAVIVGLGLLIVGLAALYMFLRQGIPAFLKFRGARVVVCPETLRPAGVEVDAGHAALTAMQPRPELRLKECSRWPERQGCGQECLRQIEASPDDCLVRHMLDQWYEGKTCARCGKPFEAIHWHDHKPGFLASDGRTLEWSELRPEQVPDALAEDRPVCWDCYVAETFRREHPELVTDRRPHHPHHLS